MKKDADYIRRLEAKIVELTMSNDDLWQELTDAQEALKEAKTAPVTATYHDPAEAITAACLLHRPVRIYAGYSVDDDGTSKAIHTLVWDGEGGK